jgi:hypothetical protein
MDPRPRRGRRRPSPRLRPPPYVRDWSLAAGVDIFTLARRMGTSVKMIDRTYGHLVAGADVYERELLDAFDQAQSRQLGRAVDAQELPHAA